MTNGGGAGSTVATRQTLTDRTNISIREALAGRTRGIPAFLPFVGPALIASIAYIDLGNFATNIPSAPRSCRTPSICIPG